VACRNSQEGLVRAADVDVANLKSGVLFPVQTCSLRECERVSPIGLGQSDCRHAISSGDILRKDLATCEKSHLSAPRFPHQETANRFVQYTRIKKPGSESDGILFSVFIGRDHRIEPAVASVSTRNRIITHWRPCR